MIKMPKRHDGIDALPESLSDGEVLGELSVDVVGNDGRALLGMPETRKVTLPSGPSTNSEMSNYTSNIRFTPYFTVRILTRDFVDDLSDFVLPQIFDDRMRYSANIGNARVISNPRRHLAADATTDGADEMDGDYFSGGVVVLEDQELEEEQEEPRKMNIRGGV